MRALSQVARRNLALRIAPHAPIAIHKTYASIDYVNIHLYGIWALTKHGALCFNYWPEHFTERRGDTIVCPNDDPQVRINPSRDT